MRRSITLVIAAITLLVVADVVAWRVATSRLRTAWDDFVATQRAAGWQVAAGEPVAEGFPLTARLRILVVEISHDSMPIPGGIGAGADILTLELPFTSPTRIVLEPQGNMHLRIGSVPDIDFTATKLLLRGALSGGEEDATATNVQANTIFGPLTIASLQSRLMRQSGDFTLGLDQVALPANSRAILIAPTLNHAAVDASVTNTALTIRAFALDWGKLSVTGEGQIKPDAQGQPAGEAKLHVFGAAETVDDLARQGQLPQQTAGNVKTVIGLLQRNGPDGKPVVEVPLKIVNRMLTVGGFPVMRLPDVHLPIPAARTPQ